MAAEQAVAGDAGDLETGVLIDARGVTVRFGVLPAIEGVDLVLRRGEIVTLIGPNGAGKSTLVRVALGLLAPGGGSVRRRPGIRIGYVPQQVHVEETLPLTVGRFLHLAGTVAGADVEAALGEVGAAHVLDVAFQRISGGERRRVLLARALLRKPDLLVLDEPTAGVDVTGQADIYRLIGAIRRRHGCGVLLVSHDLHLVMAETDQVLCLNGHVCCHGHPEQVSRDPAYLELFGREASDALAVYTHRHDHTHDLSGHAVGGGGDHGHGEHSHGEHSHGEHNHG